jgi:trk system potassium uptake protein TrkH
VREKEYLRQRYRTILSYTGAILSLSGLLMLSPLAALWTYPEEAGNAAAFVVPAAILLCGGFAAWRILRLSNTESLSVQEGGVIVLLSWIIVILFSAWPFMSALHMDFTRAVFESVSGWTTTGLSVVDVTNAGKLILVWRSTMQLAGGAGLAIIMMSAIIGPTGVGLSAAEGRSDQLVPHVRQSARLVVMIYAGYAIAGVIAYMSADMSVFDAVNHSFAAVSTGGFSTRVQSIGYWNSPAVEAVTLPLMVLGNLSFVTAWLLLRGRLRFVARNGEVRLFAIMILLAATSVILLTTRELYPHLSKSIRVGVFETVSALTTTGFSTVGYGNWNGFGILMLILLMLIGGGTCSTAGGIKQFRVFMLWKEITWEIRSALLPARAVVERPVWEADRQIFVDNARLRRISAFVALYGMVYIAGTFILCASGYSIRDSLFEFASALGTVGLSVGITSASAPGVVLWAESLAMFLGRLEFFVVFLSAFKLARDIRRILPI